MKKIGILFGQERSFPEAVIKRINEKAVKDITAEAARPHASTETVRGKQKNISIFSNNMS